MRKYIIRYEIAYRGNGGEPLMGGHTYATRKEAEANLRGGSGLRYCAFVKPVRITPATIKAHDDVAAWARSRGQPHTIPAYIEEARKVLIGG